MCPHNHIIIISSSFSINEQSQGGVFFSPSVLMRDRERKKKTTTKVLRFALHMRAGVCYGSFFGFAAVQDGFQSDSRWSQNTDDAWEKHCYFMNVRRITESFQLNISLYYLYSVWNKNVRKSEIWIDT